MTTRAPQKSLFHSVSFCCAHLAPLRASALFTCTYQAHMDCSQSSTEGLPGLIFGLLTQTLAHQRVGQRVRASTTQPSKSLCYDLGKHPMTLVISGNLVGSTSQEHRPGLPSDTAQAGAEQVPTAHHNANGGFRPTFSRPWLTRPGSYFFPGGGGGLPQGRPRPRMCAPQASWAPKSCPAEPVKPRGLRRAAPG